jgi:predicted peptidase
VVDKQVVRKFEKPITNIVKSEYLPYLPDGYEKSKEEYPIILFLYGAGERVKEEGLFC